MAKMKETKKIFYFFKNLKYRFLCYIYLSQFFNVYLPKNFYNFLFS